MPSPSWATWERDVQQALALDPTPASGALWHAMGDAIDTHHPEETFFPVIADAKFTERFSYSITQKLWHRWQVTAAEMGKRFILPVRIHPRGQHAATDLVVLSLDDFAELYALARKGSG